MEEENRSFNWSGLLIKIILVAVFIIFTVWLLSLSHKDMSDSLDVLKDDIFSENLEKMKKAGRDYFTKEKLPIKNGEIETLTLEDMYEKNLILEIKDKNGDACSKENSYVSVEKIGNEYQMKIYLECGEEKDHVILTLNCTEFGICDLTNSEPTKKIEYQYVLYTDGKWSNWGEWSDWSKVEISKLDNRDVETKVEKEKYIYENQETNIELAKECPPGYTEYENTCRITGTDLDEEPVNPICPQFEDYTTTSREGFTCNYTKYEPYEYIDTIPDKTTVPADGYPGEGCPSGYKCVYKTVYQTPPMLMGTIMVTFYTYEVYGAKVKTETGTANCPEGYIPDVDTCKKYKLSTDTTDPVEKSCPEKDGYTLKSITDTCNYEIIPGEREVTYYRYRLREYLNGTTTYKWSTSKSDKNLLNAGYKLTGKTR